MNALSCSTFNTLSQPRLAVRAEVMLDRTQYQSKPPKKQPSWVSISNALANNRECVSIEELAALLTSGCSFCPGVFSGGKRSNDSWVQQQVFGLDFDGGYTIEQFQEDCLKWRVQPAFAYPTFNHSENDHRFRAVFVCDHVITDIRLRNLVQGQLMLMFSEPWQGRGVDQQCKDAARFFLGTNKPLISESFSSRINPIALLKTFLANKKLTNPAHYSGWVKKIATDFHVALRNRELGVSLIEWLPSPSHVGQVGETTVGVYINNAPTSVSPDSVDDTVVVLNDEVYSISWEKVNHQNKTPQEHRRAKAEKKTDFVPVRRITVAERAIVVEKCKLLKAFIRGEEHIGHHGRRILLSNLRHIEGGVKWFQEGLAARDDYRSDSMLEDSARYHWQPEGCLNCPYDAECPHKTNLLQQIPPRKRECRQVLKMPVREPVEETRARLRNAIMNCLRSEENKIFVIKSDTGVGKTEIVLGQDLDNTCYAADTHRLKNEAIVRFRQKGKNAYLWPDPPRLPVALNNKLEHCYAVGSGGTSEVYRQALEEPEVFVDAEWSSAIQRYLQALSDVHKESRVFATHEKAYQLQANPQLRTFIFDEDFTKTLITITEVRIEDIQTARKLIREMDGEGYAAIDEKLKEVLHAASRITHENSATDYSATTLHSLLRRVPRGFVSPLEALFTCEAYRKDSSEPGTAESVFCIVRQRLREDRKFIVLSATADEMVYRMLFGDRLVFIDLTGTALQGKLFSHTKQSYSKQAIYLDVKSFAKNVMNDKKKFGFDGIITHKFCAGTIGDKTCLKESEGQIPVFATFGGLQGLDSFGGKNIAVYGTPYPPEFVVKLWAHVLGIRLDEDAYEFGERAIAWNEFEMNIPTYSADSRIQRLQIWLVASELAQAVGRARLVNHDCEVHVFAKIPVSGSALLN